MPLEPLADPADPAQRIAAHCRAIPASAFLCSSLIAFNGAQAASALLLPVSRPRFRSFNRWAADTWWGFCVTLSEQLNDVALHVTGDDVPAKENAIVVVNHQGMADIPFLMVYARSKGRLGDLKWVVKEVIRYVPGIGWGMSFLDCPFISRDWTKDQQTIGQTFGRILHDQVPLWLISFAEGTRVTADKLERSRAYAQAHQLAPLRHVLLPRTKGFVATVQALRGHVTAVYDLTLGYEQGVPTLWQYIKGYAPRAHLHVERFPVVDLPTDDGALGEWLHRRFVAKDERLDRFYQDGFFGPVR